MMPQYLTQPDALHLAFTDGDTKLSISLIKKGHVVAKALCV